MKKISIQLIGFMCLVLVVSCSKTNFEKTNDGVKIALNKSTTGGIQNLKLNVISENTIQVLASATDSFSIRKSLSVIEQTGDPVDFNVAHSANTITISTSNLTAMVNVKNGTIIFLDKEKNQLLIEKERSLHFVETALDKYYNIEQQFTLSESESLHGLGQINNGLDVVFPTISLIQVMLQK